MIDEETEDWDEHEVDYRLVKDASCDVTGIISYTHVNNLSVTHNWTKWDGIDTMHTSWSRTKWSTFTTNQQFVMRLKHFDTWIRHRCFMLYGIPLYREMVPANLDVFVDLADLFPRCAYIMNMFHMFIHGDCCADDSGSEFPGIRTRNISRTLIDNMNTLTYI